MRLYKPNITNININGEDYPADSQGVIDLPDHLVTSGLFSAGWVDARGHLAQLARAEKAVSPVEVKAPPETENEPPLTPPQDPVDPPVDLTGEEEAIKPTTTNKSKKHGISAAS